jgi:hypothetical protein
MRGWVTSSACWAAGRCSMCNAVVKTCRSPENEISAGPYLFGETLGKFDQNAPIGRILDFSEGDDEPQPFDNIEVDFIVAE